MLGRREFLKLILQGAVYGNLLNILCPPLKKSLAAGEVTKLPTIWLETGTCTGDSISLDNIWTPEIKDVLYTLLDWRYDWLLMQSQSETAVKVLYDTAEKLAGQYVLIVQGTIVKRDGGNYNHVLYHEGRLITGMDLVRQLGLKARYVVAFGTCATFGGVVAAHPNPSQSVGVQKILPEKRVINVSGCPTHPDWIMGTLLHLILYGEPELDKFGRPLMFYGETVHNNCPRRHFYDQGFFATAIGQKECLYRVGCKGPVTYADCPVRHWNDRLNWPIGCNSPCIGCTEPGFPDQMEPFHAHLSDIPFPGGTRVAADALGLGTLAFTGAAIAGHAALSLYNGRMHRNLLNSTVKTPKRPPLVKSETKHYYWYKPEE